MDVRTGWRLLPFVCPTSSKLRPSPPAGSTYSHASAPQTCHHNRMMGPRSGCMCGVHPLRHGWRSAGARSCSGCVSASYGEHQGMSPLFPTIFVGLSVEREHVGENAGTVDGQERPPQVFLDEVFGAVHCPCLWSMETSFCNVQSSTSSRATKISNLRYSIVARCCLQRLHLPRGRPGVARRRKGRVCVVRTGDRAKLFAEYSTRENKGRGQEKS